MTIQENVKNIVKYIGSVDNIKELTHCATRLRFTVNDFGKIDEESLKKVNGVLGSVRSGQQYHVIIGQDVEEYYKIIDPVLEGKEHAKDTSGEKISLFTRFCNMISAIFTPILPVLVASGLLSSFLVVASATETLSTESNSYIVLNFIANSGFYFLPVYLGFSSAARFGCNRYLGAMLGSILIHPNLLGIVSSGDPISIFGLPITLVNYSSSVIPIILSVWVMSYVEKFADKISPKAIKFFLKPLFTMFVMSIIALVVIGPIGTVLGEYVVALFTFIDSNASWAATIMMSIFAPFFVMTGIAYSFLPAGLASIATLGYESFGIPGMLCANVAQGGAALSVAVKTKNYDLRSLAATSGLTAVLGITEPALYGVNLRKKRPLYGAMIGGGMGGIYAGLSSLKAFAFSSPGVASLAIFVEKGSNSNFINALISISISFVGAFVATWILGFDDEFVEEKDSEPDLKIVSRQNIDIMSPVTGELIPLSRVNDEVFSQYLIGNGVAIKPSGNVVVAPVSGIVTSMFPSKHAVGIIGDNNVEILIHVGLETVNLDGKYFKTHVNKGDHVSVGDQLISFDLESLKKENFDTIIPVVVTNSGDYSSFKIKETGNISKGEGIIEVY